MTVRRALAAAVVALVVVGAVTALVVGGLALECRAATRLDAAVSAPLAALLPGGQVGETDVTDSPALLAERRDRVQQAVLHGRSEGHDVLMIVREYDRPRATAQSVSWQISGIAFAPGWAGVRAEGGAYTARARATVDGHLYEVTASARPGGPQGGGGQAPTAVVEAAALTVDGSALAVAEAPAVVRTALAPVAVAVPDPQAGAEGRSVWFDEQGAGVELYARDVSARRA